MNKYFNIHTASNGNVTIFLYGEIGDYGDVKNVPEPKSMFA